MKWSGQAEAALKQVPFFVRKKVRNKVEAFAREAGSREVTPDHVEGARKQFLAGMRRDVKGFQLDRCFGASGCRHSAVDCGNLVEKAGKILEEARLLPFLKQVVGEDLKYHHEFRVSCSDCPNGCSQPQIKDVGIIGAVLPGVSNTPCSGCGVCVAACPDHCIDLNSTDNTADPMPVLDMDQCMRCGQCTKVCPTGTLVEKEKGFRVLLGGRLGRHPRLGIEMPGILTQAEVLRILENALSFYKAQSKDGTRFSRLLTSDDIRHITG